MATRDREQLKAWIDEDRDMLVAFLRAFVRCKGPNPPGDTRSTADFITMTGKSPSKYTSVTPFAACKAMVACLSASSLMKRVMTPSTTEFISASASMPIRW